MTTAPFDEGPDRIDPTERDPREKDRKNRDLDDAERETHYGVGEDESIAGLSPRPDSERLKEEGNETRAGLAGENE
ncbi:MAG: hypothetical protein HOQ05_00600 [Corynebacteriales bacterium]|nr:hypothetical protein [Mycobacteriales bacterium]